MSVPLNLLLFLQAFTVTSVYSAGKSVCHNNLKHYEELKCTPAIDPESGCIVSYDCNSISAQKQDKCYYQGKEFAPGEELAQAKIRSNCVAGCKCQNLSGRGHFNCANIECPEVFQPAIKKGCVRKYSHDMCCSIGQQCKEESNTPVATCEYGGEVWSEGQAFYPKEKPCKKCICKSGFNGTFESPFCEEIFCELELHYADYISQGCTPVYYGDDSCCPIYWHCPNENDTIVQEDLQQDGKDSIHDETRNLKCKFGKLEMRVGQRLAPPIRENCLECSCKVPPFLSCAVNIECQKKS